MELTRKIKKILTLFLSLALFTFAAYLFTTTIISLTTSQGKNEVAGVYTSQSVGTIYNKKVYMLIYDPVMSNGQTLYQYLGWNDPDDLVQEYISWLKTTTSDKVNYTVVVKNVVPDFTTFTDGSKYTESTYLACLANNANCLRDGSGNALMTDYVRLLSTYNICSYLNAGTIDELWMFGAPWMGWWEASQAGTHGFSTNGPVFSGTSCSTPLNIMGFSYERGVSEMVEDMMHRIEGTMTTAYGGWQQNSLATTWNKYGLVAHQSSTYGFSGCGSCHYAPNSTSDYDWSNTAYASTYCDEFFTYPNDPVDTSVRKTVNCYEWGCTSLGYFRWWLQHFPSKTGIAPDNKYADWWKYVLEPMSVYDVLTYVSPTPTLTPTPTPLVTSTTTTTSTVTPLPTVTTVVTTTIVGTTIVPTTAVATTKITSTPTTTVTTTTTVETITPTTPITTTQITTPIIIDNSDKWEILDQSEPVMSGNVSDTDNTANTDNKAEVAAAGNKVLLSVAIFSVSGLALGTGIFFLLKYLKLLSFFN